MKLGFFEAEGWEKEILERELPDLEIYFTTERLTKENVKNFQDLDILSIFISSEIDKEIIDSLPNLKLITTRSTGYDHIYCEYCKSKGILVCNVPEYGTKTVAEWTIGLMLNLMRKIYYAIDQIKETESFDLKNLRGEELYGKTLGVIGTGRIGKEVIKLAKAFGMNILAYDIYPDENFAKEYNVTYTSLEELLKNSDVITIHVNLNPSTYHLINKENIKFIKPGAYLINTARGGIVETEALLYALKEGILQGAALDVLEEETEIKEELELLVKYTKSHLPESSDRIEYTRIERPNNNIHPNKRPNDIPEYKPNENQKFGLNSGNEHSFGQDSGSNKTFGQNSGSDNIKETAFTLWQNHILMKMPNVLITPHNAFNSKEAIERILMTTIENIKKFLEGNPINLVK
jgi:D-lactate dehydrogenase